MKHNYRHTITIINQALSTLAYDPKVHDAKHYLMMAMNVLADTEKRNNKVHEARKKMEELGKKKHAEWQESIKNRKNLNLGNSSE